MKSSIRKTLMFSSSVVALSLLVFPVAAQIQPVGGEQFGIAEGETVGDAVGYVLNIVNIFLVFVGIVAAIFLIYGGVQYIISRGDQGAIEKAKSTILYAIIGLLVVGLSAVIVNFTVSAVR